MHCVSSEQPPGGKNVDNTIIKWIHRKEVVTGREYGAHIRDREIAPTDYTPSEDQCSEVLVGSRDGRDQTEFCD